MKKRSLFLFSLLFSDSYAVNKGPQKSNSLSTNLVPETPQSDPVGSLQNMFHLIKDMNSSLSGNENNQKILKNTLDLVSKIDNQITRNNSNMLLQYIEVMRAVNQLTKDLSITIGPNVVSTNDGYCSIECDNTCTSYTKSRSSFNTCYSLTSLGITCSPFENTSQQQCPASYIRCVTPKNIKPAHYFMTFSSEASSAQPANAADALEKVSKDQNNLNGDKAENGNDEQLEATGMLGLLKKKDAIVPDNEDAKQLEATGMLGLLMKKDTTVPANNNKKIITVTEGQEARLVLTGNIPMKCYTLYIVRIGEAENNNFVKGIKFDDVMDVSHEKPVASAKTKNTDLSPASGSDGTVPSQTGINDPKKEKVEPAEQKLEIHPIEKTLRSRQNLHKACNNKNAYAGITGGVVVAEAKYRKSKSSSFSVSSLTKPSSFFGGLFGGNKETQEEKQQKKILKSGDFEQALLPLEEEQTSEAQNAINSLVHILKNVAVQFNIRFPVGEAGLYAICGIYGAEPKWIADNTSAKKISNLADLEQAASESEEVLPDYGFSIPIASVTVTAN